MGPDQVRTSWGNFLGLGTRDTGCKELHLILIVWFCASSFTLLSFLFHHPQKWGKVLSYRDLDTKCLRWCLEHSNCTKSAFLLLIIQKLYIIDGDAIPHACKPCSFVYLCFSLPSCFYIYLICIDTEINYCKHAQQFQ